MAIIITNAQKTFQVSKKLEGLYNKIKLLLNLFY
jgi:hypothetical protein